MDFGRALGELSDFFRDHDEPFAVIGGLALAAYGIVRTTQDVDVVVPRVCQEGLVAHLETLGYETLHRSVGYSNHLHPEPARGRLDVVYVDAATAEKLFPAARTLPVSGARELPVPSPEHLAAMKVLAMKNDPGRRFQELADIRALLRIPGVDRAAVRRAFVAHDMLAHYDELEATL